MAFLEAAAVGSSLLSIGEKLVDRLIPDPAKREEARIQLLLMERQGELDTLKVNLSAILAEAQSADPWTSRARPSFLYVMYVLILGCIPAGVASVFAPDSVTAITRGMNAYLAAIPESLWWLFGSGFLGYSTARMFEKRAGAAK